MTAVAEGGDLGVWDVALQTGHRVGHVGQQPVLDAVDDAHRERQRRQPGGDLLEPRRFQSDAGACQHQPGAVVAERRQHGVDDVGGERRAVGDAVTHQVGQALR